MFGVLQVDTGARCYLAEDVTLGKLKLICLEDVKYGMGE